MQTHLILVGSPTGFCVNAFGILPRKKKKKKEEGQEVCCLAWKATIHPTDVVLLVLLPVVAGVVVWRVGWRSFPYVVFNLEHYDNYTYGSVPDLWRYPFDTNGLRHGTHYLRGCGYNHTFSGCCAGAIPVPTIPTPSFKTVPVLLFKTCCVPLQQFAYLTPHYLLFPRLPLRYPTFNCEKKKKRRKTCWFFLFTLRCLDPDTGLFGYWFTYPSLRVVAWIVRSATFHICLTHTPHTPTIARTYQTYHAFVGCHTVGIWWKSWLVVLVFIPTRCLTFSHCYC